MTVSIISGATSFSRLIGIDVPFGDKLLAGNVCGGSVRDTKRSVSRSLMPSSFKNMPAINDASISCPSTNGLRFPTSFPSTGWTSIAVIRNHKRPVGAVLPVIADFASGQVGPSFVNGNGLALMGVSGTISAVAVYHTAGGISQGARISIADQVGGIPSFLAASVSSTESRAHAGIAGELISSAADLVGPDILGWSGKPIYLGTDARPIDGPAVDSGYSPEVYFGLVYSQLEAAEVAQVYEWAREFLFQRTGLALE